MHLCIRAISTVSFYRFISLSHAEGASTFNPPVVEPYGHEMAILWSSLVSVSRTLRSNSHGTRATLINRSLTTSSTSNKARPNLQKSWDGSRESSPRWNHEALDNIVVNCGQGRKRSQSWIPRACSPLTSIGTAADGLSVNIQVHCKFL